MAKNRIDYSSDVQLSCYGLVSNLPVYTLMAQISKTLHLNFSMADDWKSDNPTDRTASSFMRYVVADDDQIGQALCLSNKDLNQLLFKKVKDADYIFCMDAENPIDLNPLKNKEGIVFIFPVQIQLLPQIEMIWELSIP
jgi:hypothetical protein